jgi:hypothetical protein
MWEAGNSKTAAPTMASNPVKSENLIIIPPELQLRLCLHRHHGHQSNRDASIPGLICRLGEIRGLKLPPDFHHLWRDRAITGAPIDALDLIVFCEQLSKLAAVLAGDAW